MSENWGKTLLGAVLLAAGAVGLYYTGLLESTLELNPKNLVGLGPLYAIDLAFLLFGLGLVHRAATDEEFY